MSYTPTARAGSLRAQHHGGHGFGQVTISSTPVQQFDPDAAIAALATPGASTSAPSTSAYLSSGTKGSVSPSVSLTSQKDVNAAFAASTQPGWFQASQMPTSQSSNAPMYLAIGGAIVLFGIIILATRSPKKAAAAPTANRRRRRSRS